MDIAKIKQRFGIIGSSPMLDRAIDIANQVAFTDLSVLIVGESGVGKEIFPQVIHQLSSRKHAQYVAVNCGAIPEGTIDSELFGHEKGSFTGAHETRKGYFEVADGGTIFLDEVGELPLSTQVRLLRVLETGEFMKVGSSKAQKTDVRVIAATNVNLPQAIQNGKFREDLYYRLNTVPISIPPLRERKGDISLLFRKFAADFAEKYRMPAITLTPEAKQLLEAYRWPGNIRQLKNVTEQISVIEEERAIDVNKLMLYIPHVEDKTLPALYIGSKEGGERSYASDREILYKVLFDMRDDMNALKKRVEELSRNALYKPEDLDSQVVYPHRGYTPIHTPLHGQIHDAQIDDMDSGSDVDDFEDVSHLDVSHEIQQESLSLADKEKELIIKAVNKYGGKRKDAALELGISERTLYRKIKEYNLNI
jgi:transcriptional regulator with PAS, ATPase and Fis domain